MRKKCPSQAHVSEHLVSSWGSCWESLWNLQEVELSLSGGSSHCGQALRACSHASLPLHSGFCVWGWRCDFPACCSSGLPPFPCIIMDSGSRTKSQNKLSSISRFWLRCFIWAAKSNIFILQISDTKEPAITKFFSLNGPGSAFHCDFSVLWQTCLFWHMWCHDTIF